MGQLIQDIRFALRQLKRSSGFAAIVVVTLSLGIGAATAVFSVIDAALLRPLPFAHQDRLVYPDTTARAGYSQPWSYLSYKDVRKDLKAFEALAGYSNFYRINLEAPSGPVSLSTVKGTDNFFDVFGVKPLLGRTYLPGEDQPGKDDVAVLSYEVWQPQFGGQRDVVDKAVRLDGEPYTVIGVMPAGFALLLAVVGLYGLINHEVELRTREIGIRMALGSTRGLVMEQVLRRVAALMVVGVGVGWVMTLAMKKVLASMVEMHAGHDAALLGGLTAALIVVGLLASVMPARKAATIEPMQALRNE